MSPRQQARPVQRGTQVRLRWWAVALPVAIFVALLALLAAPAEAGQAGQPRNRPAYPILGQVVDVLPKLLLNLV